VRPGLARWNARPVLPRPEECLQLARNALLSAQQALTEPAVESLLRCELCMREVADRLKQLPKALAAAAARREVAPDRATLAAAVVELSAELAHTEHLFRRGQQFCTEWIHLFSARRCGYTRRGTPARLTCQGQFDMRG